MKLICTFFILLSATLLQAQDVTGIWQGTFEQTNVVANTTDRYKYEVQINNLPSNALEGVTYSYQSTRFYGKAALKGVFTKKGKSLTFKETVMLEIRGTGKIIPCLMTCYLDYEKIGKLEILTGTYSSINANDKSDCGYGTVYLEKVVESNFEKEDFLVKKKTENNKPKTADITAKKNVLPKTATTPGKKNEVAKGNPNTGTLKSNNTVKRNNSANNMAKPKNATPKNTAPLAANKPKTVKPGAETFVFKKDKLNRDSVVVAKNDKLKEDDNDIKHEPVVKKIEEPEAQVLIERENKLVNKIFVNEKKVTLEFYDNGEIDNDTISVYRDNKLVVDKKRLSTNPIVMSLQFDDINTFFEIITVAENLGDIPPNTALMVISYGNNKRREVFLTSDEKTNAKIIVEYKK